MLSNQEKHVIAKCEAMGADKVRHNLATGRWAGRNAKYAQVWLDREDRKAAESATAVQDALARSQASAALDSAEAARVQAAEAAEANRLAREANVIARSARDKAHTANTIATVAMAVAIISAVVMAILAAVQLAR